MRITQRLMGLGLLERLIGLIIILLVPLNLLLLMSFQLLTASSVDAQLKSLEYAASAAAAAVEARIGQAMQMGEGAARLDAVLGDDFEALRREASRVQPDPRDGWMFLADANGQLLFSQIVPAGGALSRRLPPGMESAATAFRSARPVVSGVRFVELRKDWFVAIDVPIFKDGKPFRVLTVSIRCSALSKILSAQPLPEGWLTGIIDERGRFVARSRDEAGLVGKDASESWRSYKDTRGVKLMRTRDGDNTYTANVPLLIAPGWAVGIGVSETQLHAAARQAAQWVVPLSVAIVFLSALLAVSLARSIGTPLREIGTRLPLLLDQGDDGHRSTIPEIRAVEDAIHRAGTAKSGALQKLAESEQHLRLVLDNTLAFIGILSRDGTLLYVNKPAILASGVTPEEVIGKPFWDCFWWSHDPEQRTAIEGAVRRAGAGQLVRFDTVARTRPDGRLPIDFMVSAVRDGQGHITHLVPSGFDISDRKRNEEKLQLLMREVNHRSKNMLAVVQAIAGQTFPREADTMLRSFQNRLMGLSASQDLLVNNEWTGVDLAELARKQLEHLAPGGSAVQVDGPPLRVTPVAAQAIGMAFHELATNAMKYGAFSMRGGVVQISWRTPADGTFALKWAETGGPTVTPPKSYGFGTKVLRDIARTSLDGEVEMRFEPSGFVWLLTAPLNAVAARQV